MIELRPTDFDIFFHALWGYGPFAWQQKLAERVLISESVPWPQAIALPTAAGKTACIDIAVFALAAQAGRLARGEAITAPRRIFFVVDRRVIVDEAFERARSLAEKLHTAQDGILKTVADRLRHIARGDEHSLDDTRPLATHVLRGGMYHSEAWAHDPLQPTVIASTVDQVGSRLLFRAYGRGPGMWPVYAGLVANDSLIFLDEAHCAQPFLQTLNAVAHYRDWAEQPLGRVFHPVVLSATPPADTTDRFEDHSEERRDPNHPLGRRQLARKPARLVPVPAAKGKRVTEQLSKALVEQAMALVGADRQAIVIFVNRVATARRTYELLEKYPAIDRVLLTGRMRPADKDFVVAHQLQALSSAQSAGRNLLRPVIVVATQTLEVGADLDFDALVSECAGLDALRQRFGRLNRMGRNIDTQAVILVRGDQQVSSNDDPVYGAALNMTWVWLNQQTDVNQCVDFGIAGLEGRLPNPQALAAMSAPSLNAPVMLPAHVDCLAQTAPIPEPSPEVGLFLHGPRPTAADVQVCFRADLDLSNEAACTHSLEVLRLCPPSSRECVAVPIHAFRNGFSRTGVADDSTDVEGTDATASEESIDSDKRSAVRWRGPDNAEVVDTAHAVGPGDVVVLPVTENCWQELGDFPEQALPPHTGLDIGDDAYRRTRAKNLLRLHPKLIDAWPQCAAKTQAQALLAELTERYDAEPDALLAELRKLLEAMQVQAELPAWLRETAHGLLDECKGRQLARALNRIGNDEWVIVGRRLVLALIPGADVFSDEDDASASGTTRRNGQPVLLKNHLPGVESFARRFAQGCGLPDHLIKAVAIAGLLHDLGKADPRFQALLHGGSRWLLGEPLAKSAHMPKTRAGRAAARKASDYPPGACHELLSVRLTESAPELLPDDPGLRDLVLHLIATHHGHCRPFAPVVFDEAAPTAHYPLNGIKTTWSGPTALERLDSGVAERYWRLVRRYGWWGLAWLEALLRLADHRRSEWEEMHDDDV
jgi:CRISPR-associated endonuclease/helicase Cas3